jgi:dipeptidyl aminopeptidase/acylaminoacyl peptidase
MNPSVRSVLSVGLAALVSATSLTALEEVTAEAAETPRRVQIDDFFRLGEVGNPRISPDGAWVAYTVKTRDLEEDETYSRIWMAPTAGGEAIALTAEEQTSTHPRWSPDGRYLGFLSGRDEGKTQVWTLFRQGGEAVQRTNTAQDVSAFEWSPDGTKLVLVLQDPKPSEIEAHEQGDQYEEKTAPPWVIDREQFKVDYVHYLDRRRTHLYVLDLATDETTQITFGDFDDSEPAWSPDGSRIAFVSNRTDSPDTNYNSDIWVVRADTQDQGAELTQVTVNPGPDTSPAWSPNGNWITHVSETDTEAMLYATRHLAVSAASGGDLTVLTADLDRIVMDPIFSVDGGFIYFLIEDGGEQNLARIPRRGGEIDRLISGTGVVWAFDLGPAGEIAALVTQPKQPAEVFLYAAGSLSQLSFTNREVLEGLLLAEKVKVEFTSADGTRIEGFIVKPPDFEEGKRYPTILDVHGGPQSQYDWGFQWESQLFAANGYLVVHPNPRGSTGYGQEFCKAIWRAWGEPDYEDVMAAVDDAIERGWADPDRLIVTGWSYGGMMTNHVITKTDRFKAAATGASATLYVVNYGHDQYQRWWEQELGFPWEPEAREIYERMSPFNKVANVETPTLILCGEKDWNVPVINSEQLYLALKRLGVPTELVVYPGEGHGNFAPSHQKDVWERYLEWFAKHLEDGD